jgi:predicted MFS family arabinose efflux permease
MLFDIKCVFLTALLIFEVGSIIYTAASNFNLFIIRRVVAGLRTIGIFCRGLTILGLAVIKKKRLLFIGFIRGIYSILSVLGLSKPLPTFNFN